ncbi:MAG TPA: hypothetical protein PK970_13965 [Hyphomicrobiaceae bacterium]|nr:hypothetical protein [Hyphomicrobiaceae bacterium]
MIAWLTTHWRILLLIVAAPLLLWLLALAAWVVLLLAGALYHGVMLLWAFLTMVVFK